MQRLLCNLALFLFSFAACLAADAAKKTDPYGIDFRIHESQRQTLTDADRPWPDVLDTMYFDRHSNPVDKPTSIWLKNDRRAFTELLSHKQYSILVAPIQVEQYAIDGIGRALMTRYLANEVARSSGMRVPDPYLVGRALGYRQRAYDEYEIRQLGIKLGVDKILVVHTGHAGDEKMRISMRLWVRKGQDEEFCCRPELTVALEDIPFSDEDLPSEAFKRNLTKLLPRLGFSRVRESSNDHKTEEQVSLADLSDDPAMLLKHDVKSRLDLAERLVLMGTLSPRSPQHASERAFIHALSLVQDHNASDRARRVAARALFHLNRRPAALVKLGDADSAEDVALRALLNGNLSLAEQHRRKVTSEFESLVLSVEVNDLTQDYLGKSAEFVDEVKSLSLPPAWSYLVTRRLSEDERWGRTDNTQIKALLDQSYPLEGFGLQDISRGNAVLDRMSLSSDDVQLSPRRHVMKLTQAGYEGCCLLTDSLTDTWQYAATLEDIAAANLIKSVNFSFRTQGKPERAREKLDRFDAVYAGHSAFSLLRSRIALSQAESSNPDEADRYYEETRESAVLAAYVEQGQSRISRRALIQTGIGSEQSTLFLEAYVRDFPMRAYWLTYQSTGKTEKDRAIARRNARRALRASSRDFDPARQLLNTAVNDKAEQAEIAQLLKGRFDGNQDAASTLASLHAFTGDDDGYIRVYQKAITDYPEDWENYEDLGRYLIERKGEYGRASNLFMSYPGFEPGSGEGAVRLANNSYVAGSLFYWRGDFEHTRPLYEIAANLQTGSAASLGSEQRLVTLEGDHASAASLAIARASRYNSVYAYRDYVSLLFVLGYTAPAWDAFSQLMDKFEIPQMWAAAYVGNRKDGLTATQFWEWANRDDIRTAIYGSTKPVVGFALLSSVVDRKPPADLEQRLVNLEGPTTLYVDVDGKSTLWPIRNSEGYNQLIYPSRFRRNEREKFEPDTPVQPSYSLFGGAYTLLRQGSHQAAIQKFDAIAAHFPLTSGATQFVLPYFAFSSAKAGDPLRLEEFVDGLSPSVAIFDAQLSKAFFLGLRGDHAGGESALRAAFNARPHTESRPIFSEYQYAEACIWLYEETGHAPYKEFALDWARKHQQFQPTHAWAYALEAAYAEDGESRTRAIGMTLFLDPESDWLKEVPKSSLDSGRVWLGERNPFATAN